jgi:hypothetical protein
MRSQNAGNAISETQILKISWGACPARTPLAISCLQHSAHTFGDRMHTILGEGQGKWALWQLCPTTEESLKNALFYGKYVTLAIEPGFRVCDNMTLVKPNLSRKRGCVTKVMHFPEAGIDLKIEMYSVLIMYILLRIILVLYLRLYTVLELYKLYKIFNQHNN